MSGGERAAATLEGSLAGVGSMVHLEVPHVGQSLTTKVTRVARPVSLRTNRWPHRTHLKDTNLYKSIYDSWMYPILSQCFWLRGDQIASYLGYTAS